GEKNARHAAAAKLSDDGVGRFQRNGELLQKIVGHRYLGRARAALDSARLGKVCLGAGSQQSANAYLWIMPASPSTVEVSAVSRSFGRRLAVDRVDLSLSAGDCLALFGPNGAGKTTLLRLIAGLLKPSAGTVTIAGRSLRDNPQARALVGLISHQSMLYGALTARENVEFAARLYGVADVRDAARLDRSVGRPRAERRAARRAVHGPRRDRRRRAHGDAAWFARRRGGARAGDA